jgi:hypothetical protein
MSIAQGVKKLEAIPEIRYVELIFAVFVAAYGAYEYIKKKRHHETSSFMSAVSLLNLRTNQAMAQLTLLLAENAHGQGLNGNLEATRRTLESLILANQALEEVGKEAQREEEKKNAANNRGKIQL